MERNQVLVGGEPLPVRLSRQELAVLDLLWRERGRVCTREEIGDRVWGRADEFAPSSDAYSLNMLHRLVSRLRKKLAAWPELARAVETVPGVGYRFPGEWREADRASESKLMDPAPGPERSAGGGLRFPAQIGGFRLGRPLGKGLSGVVYEGRALDSQQRVAVKVFRRGLSAHPGFAARFEREAQRRRRDQLTPRPKGDVQRASRMAGTTSSRSSSPVGTSLSCSKTAQRSCRPRYTSGSASLARLKRSTAPGGDSSRCEAPGTSWSQVTVR